MPDVKISPASIVIGLAVILIMGVFGYLSFGPRPAPPPPPVLTAEAKAYLPKLALANVHMQAAESMVNQRVIEILGDITNKGDRVVRFAEVTCVFRDYYGKELTRETDQALPAGLRRHRRHLESGSAVACRGADSVPVKTERE